MKRETGYYWVHDGSDWVVAYYGTVWHYAWFTDDEDFKQIDENRIINPNE